jgi:flagellar motor switch protein FliN/FliY
MNESYAREDAPKAVQKIKLEALEPSDGAGKVLFAENMDLIRNVKVRLSVSVGSCELTVRELFELQANSVVPLDKATKEPVDVLLDNKVIARGHLVAVDDSFGVRITEIVAS